MRRRRTTLTALTALTGGALALAAVVAGVPARSGQRPSPVVSVAPAMQLARPSSPAGCAALRRWYVRAALREVGPWGLSGPPVLYAVPGSGPERTPGAAGRSGATGGTEAPAGGTITGTDQESDVAVTDGRLLVRVVGRTLVLTDVSGHRPRELSRTTLPGRWLTDAELLLRDRRVLVVAHGDAAVMVPVRTPAAPQPTRAPSTDVRTGPGTRAPASTRLLSYDLTDPAAPRLTDDRTLDGGVVSARAYADGTVRVVVTTRQPRIAFVRPGGGLTLAEATVENRRRVRAAPVDAWLPTVESGGTRHLLSACSTVRHPRQPSGFATLSVVGFPLAHPDRAVTTSVVTGGDLVSSSARWLYVATGAGGRTSVDAFALDGSRTSYVGSGSVPGVVADRSWLSERNGLLRVASTTDTPRAVASTVTVLAERHGDLVREGSLAGIGRGERLTSVRWLGDLAVLGTFSATAPLRTVDLSAPARPRLLATLRTAGSAGYLQPVGDGLVVSLGQVLLAADGTTGQAATFDLSDPRAVTRASSLRLGTDTTVDATADARTVRYLPRQRTLLVAVSSWSTGRTRILALAVAPDGRLSRAGSWSAGRSGPAARALPIGGGRVVLVGDAVRLVRMVRLR